MGAKQDCTIGQAMTEEGNKEVLKFVPSTSRSCKVMPIEGTVKQLTQCRGEAHERDLACLAEAGPLVQCPNHAAWGAAGQARNLAAVGGGAADGADGLAPRGSHVWCLKNDEVNSQCVFCCKEHTACGRHAF